VAGAASVAVSGQELLRLALVARPVRYVRNHWAELLVAAMVLVGVLFEDAVVRPLLPLLGREELARDVTVGMLQLLMLGGILVRAVRHHALVCAWSCIRRRCCC
jgi:hypothetical protein